MLGSVTGKKNPEECGDYNSEITVKKDENPRKEEFQDKKEDEKEENQEERIEGEDEEQEQEI